MIHPFKGSGMDAGYTRDLKYIEIEGGLIILIDATSTDT